MADDGGLRLIGGRQHLHGIAAWRHLDTGEDRIRVLFPKTALHTTLGEGNETAILVLYGDDPRKDVLTFEEPLENFPSDHMIAQLMLVIG